MSEFGPDPEKSKEQEPTSQELAEACSKVLS